MRTRLTVSMLGLFTALVLSGTCFAAGPAEGTWTWTTPGRNGGQGREQSITLKQDGDKVTGSMKGRQNDTEISDGTFKDGTLSFSITREFNGNKRTTKYTGKIDGDTLKGSIEYPGRNGGEGRKVDWEAKRSK